MVIRPAVLSGTLEVTGRLSRALGPKEDYRSGTLPGGKLEQLLLLQYDRCERKGAAAAGLAREAAAPEMSTSSVPIPGSRSLAVVS